MNHLAHLFLSPPDQQARIGNLLGDFARGVDPDTLPAQVRLGWQHHLAVDAFTDRHPEVLACKRCFSAQRRRFAGIALDVLFDHYLLRHWDRFCDTPSEVFIHEVYRDLERGRYLMPDTMARTTARMVQQDWFNAYRDLDQVGLALDRIAQRIRFSNRFEGMIEELRPLDATLEAHFLTFFPQLLAFSQTAEPSGFR